MTRLVANLILAAAMWFAALHALGTVLDVMTEDGGDCDE